MDAFAGCVTIGATITGELDDESVADVRTLAGGTLLASGSSVATMFCLRGFLRAGATDSKLVLAVEVLIFDILAGFVDMSNLAADDADIAATAAAVTLLTLKE